MVWGGVKPLRAELLDKVKNSRRCSDGINWLTTNQREITIPLLRVMVVPVGNTALLRAYSVSAE